jgi:hypothetical protein
MCSKCPRFAVVTLRWQSAAAQLIRGFTDRASKATGNETLFIDSIALVCQTAVNFLRKIDEL